METKRLSLKEKLGFGVCDIGGNALFTLMAFWLMNYLTDTVGLEAGLAGIALMIGKIWDAVTDPAIGTISDRTKTRWGKRRPYIFLGGIVVLISMLVMFTNPQIKDQNWLFVWALGAYCFLCLGFTILNIPYSALTPELTSDYNERTELNGFRMVFAVIGTFVGAGAVQPIISLFIDKSLPPEQLASSAGMNTGYMVMGAVVGVIILIVSWITFFTVKEPPLKPLTKPRMSIIKSYLTVFKNGPFLLVLIPWIMTTTAITVVSGTLIYYFKYIYKEADSTTLAMMILLASALIFIPIWVILAKKLGKKICYAIGLSIIALSVMLIFFFGVDMGINFAYGIMALAGIGLSTTYVLPWSIIPDTIEYDYIGTGERREGIYYGIWTFMSKLGQALASLIIGMVLQFFAFMPNVLEQSSEAVFGIRLLFGPIPAVIYVIGIVVILFYPIDRKKYAEIMEKVKVMEQNS